MGFFSLPTVLNADFAAFVGGDLFVGTGDDGGGLWTPGAGFGVFGAAVLRDDGDAAPHQGEFGAVGGLVSASGFLLPAYQPLRQVVPDGDFLRHDNEAALLWNVLVVYRVAAKYEVSTRMQVARGACGEELFGLEVVGLLPDFGEFSQFLFVAVVAGLGVVVFEARGRCRLVPSR